MLAVKRICFLSVCFGKIKVPRLSYFKLKQLMLLILFLNSLERGNVFFKGYF